MDWMLLQRFVDAAGRITENERREISRAGSENTGQISSEDDLERRFKELHGDLPA